MCSEQESYKKTEDRIEIGENKQEATGFCSWIKNQWNKFIPEEYLLGKETKEQALANCVVNLGTTAIGGMLAFSILWTGLEEKKDGAEIAELVQDGCVAGDNLFDGLIALQKILDNKDKKRYEQVMEGMYIVGDIVDFPLTMGAFIPYMGEVMQCVPYVKTWISMLVDGSTLVMDAYKICSKKEYSIIEVGKHIVECGTNILCFFRADAYWKITTQSTRLALKLLEMYRAYDTRYHNQQENPEESMV